MQSSEIFVLNARRECKCSACIETYRNIRFRPTLCRRVHNIEIVPVLRIVQSYTYRFFGEFRQPHPSKRFRVSEIFVYVSECAFSFTVGCGSDDYTAAPFQDFVYDFQSPNGTLIRCQTVRRLLLPYYAPEFVHYGLVTVGCRYGAAIVRYDCKRNRTFRYPGYRIVVVFEVLLVLFIAPAVAAIRDAVFLFSAIIAIIMFVFNETDRSPKFECRRTV